MLYQNISSNASFSKKLFYYPHKTAIISFTTFLETELCFNMHFFFMAAKGNQSQKEMTGSVNQSFESHRCGSVFASVNRCRLSRLCCVEQQLIL